jgi:hypothetical protein
MTEQQWKRISMQNNEFDFKELPISVFHEYYLEKGGVVTDLNKFTEIFFVMVNNGPVLLRKTNRLVNYTYPQVIHGLFHYYNKKFNINQDEPIQA